ncbi:hypothetical protein EDB19DRAFT_972825 [Suillus lakei]|nr:hypothetical protein EDB19DRAFT_972825 [Suillus lakei]
MLSCPSASLFPNLRKLTWHADGTRSAAEFLRMAFVPSLQILNIRSYPTSLAFFLGLFVSWDLMSSPSEPNLPHRSVIEFSMLPFVIQPISQLHHLRTLDVPDLGKQGIQHIMLLRALQSLYLDLRQSTPSTWDIQSPSQFSGFQDLQSLYLGVSTFERPSNFLSSLRIVRSRKFAVRVGFASQVAQSPAHVSTMLPQFLAILQERCDNDRLQCFYIFGYLNMVLTESGVFTPLRAFSNLTVLFIERGCDISMSDEELCHLTGALPKLRILKINCCVTVDTTTVPTFHGLIGIIRLCPVLTSLALVIDTTKLDGIDIRNPGGGENFKTYLNNLTLGNSIIDSPLNVALILSGISPRLKQVNLDCWDTAPMNLLPQKKSAMEQWVLVNSFLSGFGVVRERPGLIVT